MNRHPLEPFVFDSINRRKGTISIPELAIDLAAGVRNTQKEIIMGLYSAEIAGDQTNAICHHCAGEAVRFSERGHDATRRGSRQQAGPRQTGQL